MFIGGWKGNFSPTWLRSGCGDTWDVTHGEDAESGRRRRMLLIQHPDPIRSPGFDGNQNI